MVVAMSGSTCLIVVSDLWYRRTLMVVKQVLQSRTNPTFVPWKGGAVSQLLTNLYFLFLLFACGWFSVWSSLNAPILVPHVICTKLLFQDPWSSWFWSRCMDLPGGLDSQWDPFSKWQKIQGLLLSSSTSNMLHKLLEGDRKYTLWFIIRTTVKQILVWWKHLNFHLGGSRNDN